MEIRENPYDDLDVGEGKNDRTVEMADIPFGDGMVGDLANQPQREASPLTLKLPNAG